MAKTNVLLVGESWASSATHTKGFDQFNSVTFHLGAEPLAAALKDSQFALTCVPSHEAATAFPFDLEGLSRFEAIVLSDVGANTSPAAERLAERRADAKSPQAHPGMDARRRRPSDHGRISQLSGHRREGALARDAGRGRAPRDLPAL